MERSDFLKNNNKIRIHISLTDNDKEKLTYWARQEKLSISEFIPIMLELWIDFKNGNYNLQTLEVQRLNQLIDSVDALSKGYDDLANVVVSGFSSLQQLTRGESYLSDDYEDGE